MKGFLCLVLASVLVALVWGAQKREEIVMIPMRDGGKQRFNYLLHVEVNVEDF